MSVASFLRIKRGSDGGPYPQTLQCASFWSKLANINVSRCAVAKQALVPARRYNSKT